MRMENSGMHSFEEYREIINSHLTDLIPDPGAEAAIIAEAMAYSLMVGGKRLRPSLLLASCEFAGGSIDEALPYALALEYIHTYSLIHDDLPAMDNDDLRRGKPTNHKVYGEAMAILAGDGLLSTAAESVAGEALKYCGDPVKMTNHIRAAHEILKRAGVRGMIAGQTADIMSEHTDAGSGLVRYIEEHKTGDLITAPVRAGLMLAGAAQDMLDAFSAYAMNLGIAFQILDDILDIEGDAALMGKTLGKDAEEGKCNYAFVYGLEAAKTELARLTADAQNALALYGESASFFTELADKLKIRNN